MARNIANKLSAALPTARGLGWLGIALGVGAISLAASLGVQALRGRALRARARQFDYSDRSGFPRPVGEMVGAAHRAMPPDAQ